jgi:4-nitrophenyl phosphatase
LAIYDTMRHLANPIYTYALGVTASFGTVLLAAGTKGFRYALPHATIHVHQPLGGAQGQATDVEIQAKEILRLRDSLNHILVDHTGQPLDVIERDTERDFYMDAKGAMEYGLVDQKKKPKRNSRTMNSAGSAAPGLETVRGLIIDLDGVLWEGETPLPGMSAFIAFLRRRGLRFQLATNNASRTPEMYQDKLARMGASVELDEILTSAMATGMYLKAEAKSGASVFVIGEEGARRAVEQAGLRVAAPDELHADYVVCGMDRGLTWDKLGTATINLRNGARFIGTNPDVTFPTERGTTHGNGAILAALSAASGVAPEVIGKPFGHLYRLAIERLRLPKEQVAALGDRLETDILGAQNTGIRSILVLTGVTTRAEAGRSDIRPTWTFEDLPALQTAWSSIPA